jgi:O-antigen/teichoic acid export membrane protein
MQNSAAIILNIAGNVLLIPRYGVYAAAWMTAATEALVCAGSLFSLRHELDFARLARVSARPALASLLAAAVAVPIDRWQLVAAPVAACVFVVAMSVLRAWPTEFHPARLLPAGASLRWARR